MPISIGIDPGVNGAIAFLYGERFEHLAIFDIPVLEIKKGKSVRKRIDMDGLMNIIHGGTLEPTGLEHAYVEQVSAQPGSGVAASFTFGFACGAIEMALVTSFTPFTYVSAMKWKKELSVPKDKDGARLRASQLLPEHAGKWNLKKHHNRAEAALIALYGSRKTPGF